MRTDLYLEADALEDPELNIIAAILKLLSDLEHPARVRSLNYIGARLNPDNS